MNKYVVSGNLTKDVELTFSPGSGTGILKNTVATRRKIKDKITGKYESDFIPIVAFGKTAEFIAEHFIKGQGILIEAHMQSGSYENKEGKKVYTLEAIADNVEFLGNKEKNNKQQVGMPMSAFGGGDFGDDDLVRDDLDSSMPF